MVSVILPTFNRAAFLTEAIRSVLQQDGVQLELIIVDDGSEDNTPAVVSAFGDDRIRYYRLPHTGKLSQLKNFAIDRTAGEFIAFMDSDDMWTAGKLRQQVELLRRYRSAPDGSEKESYKAPLLLSINCIAGGFGSTG